MYADRMTWSVWVFGLALLLYWRVETVSEFRALFARRRRKHT
jgi:hypothetical protein